MKGLTEYLGKDDDSSLYLPFIVEGDGVKELQLLKKNKTNAYVSSEKEFLTNGQKSGPGVTKIVFKKFDRKSSWDEHIATRYAFQRTASDKTEEMLAQFDDIYSANKS